MRYFTASSSDMLRRLKPMSSVVSTATIPSLSSTTTSLLIPYYLIISQASSTLPRWEMATTGLLQTS